MSDDGFIRAILANPDDHTLRLIYADWLEERGDPRSEVLRAQAALLAMAVEDKQYATLGNRLAQLQAAVVDQEWLTGLDCTFRDRYRKVLARILGRPLKARDGYPEREIVRAEKRLGVRVPKALRDYYRVAGRLHVYPDRIICPNEELSSGLFGPEEWTIDRSGLTFMTAFFSQLGTDWRVDISDPRNNDPAIFHSEDPGGSSIAGAGGCSDFLIVRFHTNVAEGLLGCGTYTDHVPQAAMSKLDRDWFLVGESQDLRAYSKTGQALVLYWGQWLGAGAQTRGELEAIAVELGLTWRTEP